MKAQIIFTLVISQFSGLFVYASDEDFLLKLNRRVDKITKLKIQDSGKTKNLTEKIKSHNDIFLSRIKSKISPSDFEKVQRELESFRELTHPEVSKNYDLKIGRDIAQIDSNTKMNLLGFYQPLVEIPSKALVRDYRVSNASNSFQHRNNVMLNDLKNEDFSESLEVEEELSKDSIIHSRLPSFVEAENMDGEDRLAEGPVMKYLKGEADLYPNDDDSLFGIVSKAYKRSYSRVKIISLKR